MNKRILIYFNTLKYLKPVQWRYRFFYLLRKSYWRLIGLRFPARRIPPQVCDIRLAPSIRRTAMWQAGTNRFEWLCLPHTFGPRIDWGYAALGKLWTYNLHYFEYILGEGVQPEKVLPLLEDFLTNLEQHPEANEPYPLSLRIIFWIRFFASHRIRDPQLDAALYAQAYALSEQREKHLLGNHYLENGFGLLFAAFRYEDKVLLEKAISIFETEIGEQILADGGHFERSPMYHQIILYRLLDACNLLMHNANVFALPALLAQFQTKAAQMLGWLQQICFQNGQIPLFNDAALDIAPTTEQLLTYGKRLGITPVVCPLQDSGYRKIVGPHFELVADMGDIGPDYIPGHAHSDTLSFEMAVEGALFIVDMGTSTYEKNEQRQLERSTAAHNTVRINNCEQSEVWGGFRVAKRAKAIVLVDTSQKIAATHTGYDKWNLRHERVFEVKDKCLKITDSIVPVSEKKQSKLNLAEAFFHFHPDITITRITESAVYTPSAILEFEGAKLINTQRYEYAPRFNQRIGAQQIIVQFDSLLITTIKLISPTDADSIFN